MKKKIALVLTMTALTGIAACSQPESNVSTVPVTPIVLDPVPEEE